MQVKKAGFLTKIVVLALLIAASVSLLRMQGMIANAQEELLELAEKVRTLLSAYDPTDPAVAALKQSPAYQKVAHLIEGSEVPVAGGLLQ